MKESLKDQTLQGVFWAMAEKFGGYIVQFILGVFMARILNPRDYGLIGMIMFFFAVANAIVEGGLGNAYIQKKDANETDASTVFYLNLIISGLLYALFWITAPLVASFFNEEVLVGLIRFVMITLLINAFGIVQLSVLRKNIKFKKNSIIVILSTSVSGIIGIACALKGLGAWSLAVQMVLNRLIYVSGLWIASKWKPQYFLNVSSAKELFQFGGWMLFSSVFTYAFTNLYQLVIGKIYTPTLLGFYSNSKKYINIASQQITGAIGMVAFPVLAKMQDDSLRMKNGIYRFNENSMFISIPVFIVLFLIGESFIYIVLGEKWGPMLPYFKLFCILGFITPLANVNLTVLLAAGYSKLRFNISLVINGLRLINILLLAKESIFILLIGEIIINVIQLIIFASFNRKFFGYGFIHQMVDIKSVLAGGVFAFLLGYLGVNMVTDLFYKGALAIIIPATVFLMHQFIFNKNQISYLLKLVVSKK